MSQDRPAHEVLRAYATHHAPQPWDWKRGAGVTLLHPGWRSGRKSPLRRLVAIVVDTFRPYVRPTSVDRMFEIGWPEHTGQPWYRHPVIVWQHLQANAIVNTRLDDTPPDGRLDGAGVIAYWEEVGEYLQLLQPSVGVLVADFLRDDPTHPSALAISAEIDAIRQRYAQRAEAGEV